MTHNDSALTLFAKLALGSMAAIDPSREDVLRAVMEAHGATFQITEARGLQIRATWRNDASAPPIIQASRPALAFLWATTYYHTVRALWVRGCSEAALAEPPYSPTPMTDAGAQAVLAWALTNRDLPLGQREPWPDNLPGPRFASVPAGQPLSPAREATEIALVATAWMMHHELAHVQAGYGAHVDSNHDEREADKAATNWLLSGVAEPAILEKRALGPAYALIPLIAHEFERRPTPRALRDHPAPEERLMVAMMHPVLGADHLAYHAGNAFDRPGCSRIGRIRRQP